jgi:uncharacterized protein YfaS (alpha-2-macroglobulin family)/tetratricopeptide (TPR) repeat protein
VSTLDRRTTVAMGALWAMVVVFAGGPPSMGEDEKPGASPAAASSARGLDLAAPVVPATVVAAMQEKKFDEAAALVKTWMEREGATADEKAYGSLVAGTAQRLASKLDDARATLETALKAAPNNRWAAKQRSALAAVELAARRFNAAEALARAEAESLLATDRKDRLAGVYRGFADRLLNPGDPAVAADPEGAHALLEQARGLAQGLPLRAQLGLAMAQASQKAGNPARAAEEFRAYLDAFAKADVPAADIDAARFGLGTALLDAGQPLPARLAWDELIRAPKAKTTADFHARAMFDRARTFGIPTPPDDTQLNLGVAALKRFLEAYPAHWMAPIARSQIGQAYQSRGKAEEALAAFRALLRPDVPVPDADQGKRDLADRRRSASFAIGQLLQSQGKFDEAVAAFQAYVAQYPDGPQSADAQRAVLDTRLAQADDHERNERRKEARAIWQEFAAANPLDPRVPEAMYRIGASLAAEAKLDEAIAAWDLVASKFPGTDPAGHALFDAAALVETKKGDPTAAIERFRKVEPAPWKALADQRIAVMEGRELTVVTPRAFRSGEVPQLKISTRNLEKLTFAAYKLDPEAYFRKKRAMSGVESLDIGLVAPDAEWTEAVPNFAKYRPIEHAFDLKELKAPGVWVVKVGDEKHLQATTLVLGSDVDAIVKASREQVLVFAQDMTSGKGRAGARVLIAEGDEVLLDAKTGDDGVLLAPWPKPRNPQSPLQYLVLDGKHAAGSGLALPGNVSQGLTARAYIVADRPAYRPGQTVSLRTVVRQVKDGQYAVEDGAEYKLEVVDARGRPFLSRPVTLSKFGTVAESVALDDAAPLGTYRVRLYRPGRDEFAGQFEVQAYQLQKVDISIDLPRTVFYRGETVKGAVVAKYQYGTPLAKRPVSVQLPDGRTLAGTTDDGGRYEFEFPTEGYGESQMLALQASLPEDGVGTAVTVAVAVQGFGIELSTPRSVYLASEAFNLELNTADALGKPLAQEISVRVLKRITRPGGVIVEREVSATTAKTDEKTGKASVALKVDDEEGGAFLVRAAGTDRFGNPIVADRPLTISGSKDAQKLRVLADRTRYKVGEKAAVRLINRGDAGTALLTWEADRVLTYKIMPLAAGETPLEWAIDGPQFPNFTLTAARMAQSRFDQARLDIEVERDLRVTLKPVKETVAPGEMVEVEVTTADQLGQPVAAEVAIALVDEALLRLFGDPNPAIGTFFYGQRRTGAFTTESSCTFVYRPPTVPVAEAVVEEAERSRADLVDSITRGEIARRAGRQVVATPAPAPAAASEPMSAGRMSLGAQVVAADEFDGPKLQLGEGREELAKDMAGKPGMAAMGGGMGGMGGASGSLPLAFRSQSRDKRKSELFDRTKPAVKTFNGSFFGMDFAADGAELFGDQAGPSRQAFVETAYWAPSVVTGADGKAVVKFAAPTALSRYRFQARGATGADTLVGQTEANLNVFREFFVDLKKPASLFQGDKPRFIARLHHGAGLAGTATVTLKIYAGGREQTYPKTVEVKSPGVDELIFEPFEVPDGDVVRITATAKLNAASDELIVEVPIRPWGIQAYASASGTASSSTTAMIALSGNRQYDEPELIIALAPSLRRLLVELALGRDAYPLIAKRSPIIDRCFPVPPDTVTDRASDLLAAASTLSYLRAIKGANAPEAARLGDRIRGLVGELVTLQNDDGGWPWVAGSSPAPTPQPRGSERLASARAFWALAAVEPLGLLSDPGSLDRGGAYLTQAIGQADTADLETRAALLHALSARGKANFEQANALNRSRDALSDAALAYLALTFVNLERKEMAGEVVGVLVPRAQRENTKSGEPARVYWNGASRHPGLRGSAEATALAAFAIAQARPAAPELEGSVSWLLAHRVGNGWQPHLAKGPALAALGAFYARAGAADDRYRVVVSVNDQEVYRAEIAGETEGRLIAVPRAVVKPAEINRVRFDIEGRGTLGYSAVLSGFTRDFTPEQDWANRPFVVRQHIFQPSDPLLDGRALPTGFGVAVGATYFENWAKQVELGGRTHVRIDAHRVTPAGQPAWERDYLILEDTVPAGTTLVEGSVQANGAHYELIDGLLRVYFAPDQEPSLSYDVFGTLPGAYRSRPPILSSAYEPGRRHMAKDGGYDLQVLAPGEPKTDAYKATPDELYARGKGLFDAGRTAEAAAPLEALWAGYTLRDDVAKEAARMLLFLYLEHYDARKIVQYFEVLRDKSPDLVVPFEKLLIVGRAYRDLGEFERAYLVWRGVAEASYLEDARLGELLRQRGKNLEALGLLVDLWRDYPGTAAIESDLFGLAQLCASLAGKAVTEPVLRSELADAGKTRSDLLLQAIRLSQVYLTLSPTSPVADEASLALVGAFLELENHEAVVKLAEGYAKLYPTSTYLDSFQYSAALGLFHLGQYDRAIAIADAIAKATYKDANGIDQPSPNKWQALYIIGQIRDARRQFAEAVASYRQVSDRFTDAAEAVASYTRKELKLPEVSVIRPEPAKVAGAEGAAGPAPGALRNVGLDRDDSTPDPRFPDRMTLTYRNIAEVDVKVYPVDLLRLYLTRRNLDGIAGIDLAGITPLLEQTIKLGTGEDFETRKKALELPLTKEGAYLVMVRGGELYASGIVLVTPLDLEVIEEAGNGRVRVTVRDALTKAPVPRVQVKVIGTGNGTFLSGETDLRGVYVAEGVVGQVTALGRLDPTEKKDAPRYVFHRGRVEVGAPPAPAAPAEPGQSANAPAGQPQAAESSLEQNIMLQNRFNQEKQIQRLQERYSNPNQKGTELKNVR